MTRDIELAHQAGVLGGFEDLHPDMVEFVKLIRADEREKVAQWMIARGYATGHGDTIEDLLQELDWQIAENWNRAMINGVETEREACAKVCETYNKRQCYNDEDMAVANECAFAIRERGAP